MKNMRNTVDPKANFEISKLKMYQKKIKRVQEEKQTLLKEKKKLPSNINREWHEKHPMTEGASVDQRIEWHLAHAANCLCRPIPEKLKAEMKKRQIKLP